jgi:hypothetical protein
VRGFVVVCLLGTLAAVGTGGWPVTPGGAVAVAQGGEKKVREYGKKDFFTTVLQDGAEYVFTQRVPGLIEEVDALTESIKDNGCSTLFLVQAPDLKAAVVESGRVMQKRQDIDFLYREGDAGRPRARYWLVVYFGWAYSCPPRWPVQGAYATADSIVVTSRDAELEENVTRTKDSEPYLAWVSLGELEPGKKQLILRDSRTKETLLSRRVVIQ